MPEIDDRILDAVRKLLKDTDYFDLTMEAIAQEAGVGKQTVYRRWSRKPLLVYDAVLGREEDVISLIPDTGSFELDVAEVVRIMIAMYDDDDVRPVLRGVVADCLGEPEVYESFRDRFIAPRLKALSLVAVRAIERGEIHDDVSPDFVAHAVGGAVFAHYTVYGGEIPGFGDALVKMILRGVSAV